MNRSEFIKGASILVAGSLLQQCTSNQSSNIAAHSLALKPFEGTFTEANVSALLSRTTFGYNFQNISACKNMGLAKTIDLLLSESANQLAKPINFEFDNDPYVPIGSSWLKAPYSHEQFLGLWRKESLGAWAMENIYHEGISIKEQMVLFWNNHFGVANVEDPIFEYNLNQLLRENALGNFQNITEQVTLDGAMLRFLSGFENTKQSPNENYAREFLELFTIGKGAAISKGNYTNYTEEDVRKLAKVFTGWTYKGWYSFEKHLPIGVEFVKANHDEEVVTLSAELHNLEIPSLGKKRYKYVVQEIFKSKLVAERIVRKLYQWFVDSNIGEAEENEVIQPLSEQLMAANYEVKPVLRSLFLSEHFFKKVETSVKIKNPIEYIFNSIKKSNYKIEGERVDQYKTFHKLFEMASKMGMRYFNPPSVAGWKQYYQSPYDRAWINAGTLKYRKIFNEFLQAHQQQMDFNKFAESIEMLSSNIGVTNQFVQLLSNNKLSSIQSNAIQSMLFEGQMNGLDKKQFENNIKKAFLVYCNLPENNIL